uniref:Centriolin n=1 Tax=Varanus komodoensis TaxID=61221 RepID=A0A8D2J2T4_VARKO
MESGSRCLFLSMTTVTLSCKTRVPGLWPSRSFGVCIKTSAGLQVAHSFCQRHKEGSQAPGIRYITEPLINKLSKQENVARVTALNLSLAKDGGKKFKYIENLEKCEKLEVLNLSHNLIEKVEKLDKLLKLCDLNLSYNKISKIEGIEHLHNLQKLNLAGNEIEHVPVWMGKKLRSLRILNLRKNKISSVGDFIAKLKPLKNLTSLFLSDNPVANLPHYRPFTIFHLRSLEDLEGQPVTDCDREEATERFNLEEIENLEKDLEKAMKELEDLNNKQSDLLEKLQQQEDLNKSLKQNHLRQKQSCKDLESELETKNELLKQKTVELTRACQKQYELEQELAFYKIDAKFEPLGYYPAEDVDLDDVPGESPYIGKARYKRNMYAVEGYIPSKAQKLQVGSLGQEEQQNNQQLKLNLLQSLDLQLQEKEKQMKGAQEKLSELHSEAVNAEQRVLKATEELRQLQDAVAQKKMLEVEKDCLRQKLSNKILLLSQLKGEALELEKQMEQQKQEMAKKEEEVEGLQIFTDSLDPKDPKHAHMKAQKASKEQQLDMMSKHYKELETCLDDMLSRIARETEEIRDLEQQLTDGQIAVNDALKKDLEAIIIGLQEYLETVKGQAKQTSDECKELRKDKEALLQKLEELEDEKNQLEIVAMDAENMRKEIADLELALHEQREVNQELQEAQGELGAYEAELEAELKARDSEISQHTEELERIKQLSQLEHSALQAELDKERQALENALTKAHLSEEKEQENSKLLSQLKQLQRENNSLKQQLQETKNQLNRAVDHLIHPEEVLARVSELKKALRTGAEIRCHNPKDILGKSLADLQKQFGEILARSQQETEAAQARERGLQEEMASRQARLEEAHEKHKLACSKAAEAKIKSEKKQNEARVRQLEDEIQHLSEQLKSMEEIQGLTDQQLQEAEEEKGRMIAQLEDLENRKKVEDARVQMQFLSLNEELKELKEAVSASERQATAELCAATDQLRALHGTVGKINQWRSQELEDAEKMSMQASQAADALARAEAEIELLQRLLKEKEEQVCGLPHSLHDAKECSIEGQERNVSSKEIGSILDEIAALRHAVSHQNDAIARLLDPLKWKGHSYYIPSSSQASTPASQSTKDSGVGLQCPMPTSVNKVHAEGERGKKKHSISPAGRGCRLHSTGRDGLQESPHRSAPHDGSYLPPPGSVIYTLLPDGAPAPQGTVVYGPPPPPGPACGGQLAPTTVIYGSPPPGAQLVHSPLPAHCSVPLVPVGVLHCNIPEHHNLENKILSLEGSIDKLMSQRPEGACPAASHHRQHKQTEELRQGIQDLLSEREELEHQVTELRRVAQKRNRRKDFIDGCMSGIISELELEKSLQHHGSIVDEIECIEKTLLKRRAELREADRLLAEAENELETTQGKTKDVIQKYNSSKQHLSWTEKEAEELERRAQEMAVRLVKADQQLRLLRAGAKDLEQHKMQQEGILKEINKVVSAKDYEFQSLSQKIEILTESLQKLQADIQVAEGNEDHHLQILKEAENILQSKKSELERLKDQTATQQEELRHLDQLLDQKKEELRLLQESIVRRSADLTEVLKEGEAEVAEKWQQIKEVKSFLADLSVQKGELSAQLSEKRSQLSLITQGIRKENENLQDTLGLIMKHKTELKHILETLQLESSELEGLKLQHNQKLNELQKMHTEILEGKLELENLQRASQQERGEMELQRQLLERMQQDVKQLNSHLCTLQKSIQALNKQKQQLEENCESLEQKLSQTERALASAEESNTVAQAEREKMDSAARKLQLDIDQLQNHKASLYGDVADLQKDLQEKIQQEERKWEDCTAKLQDQKQRLEEELAEQQRLLEQTAMRIQGAEEQIRKLQEEESCYSVLKETISKTRHQVSEQEVKLREKAAEACSLQRELELSKARENMLQHKIQAERKKAEKHIAGLKEAIQTQRAQLERALHEQKQENQCLQEEMASVEQVAQDNHQRAKQLMRNLGQIQEEYLQLQSQMKSQEDLEKRQKEMKGTVKMLKLEVRDKMRTCLKDLSQSPPEANSEAKGRTQSDLESLKENYPFTDKESRMLCFDEKLDLSKVHIMDEQWRGKARREQLQHREDWLKAQLRQCMSKQVEVLIKGKQQTEGTLHSLKRQVDVLDELVSSASTDSPFQSLNSSGFTASLHEESMASNRSKNRLGDS